MPPKKRAIGRYTSKARKKKATRASETNEQREARLKSNRERNIRARSSETNEQREARLKTDRELHARARSSKTNVQRESRLQTIRVSTARSNEKFLALFEKSGFTAQGSVNLNATTLSPQISTQTERSTCLEERAVENKDLTRPHVEVYFIPPQWTIPKEIDYYRETCDEEYITPDFIEQNTGTKSNEADEELDIKPDVEPRIDDKS